MRTPQPASHSAVKQLTPSTDIVKGTKRDKQTRPDVVDSNTLVDLTTALEVAIAELQDLHRKLENIIRNSKGKSAPVLTIETPQQKTRKARPKR